MKQIVIQLGQRVLKHRKKLIYSALAFFVCQFCFFNFNGIGLEDQVYAADSQTETPTQSDSLKEQITSWYQETAFFRKVIYVLLYPILIVAGKLIDNSFVYGEIFNFDTVLWQMRVMARNLADYALGFIFIFYIFKYLINQDSKNGPKWIISRALIAGVGIQASWFVMSALIDISTIMTYGIGGLPISILESVTTKDDDKYNPYILKRLVSVDVKNFEDYKIYLTNTTGNSQVYIAPCKDFTFEGEMLLLGPSNICYSNGTGVFKTEKTMCHVDGNVYHFSSLYDGLQWSEDTSKCEENQSKYLDSFSNSVQLLTYNKGDILGGIRGGTILQISTGMSNLFLNDHAGPPAGVGLDPTNVKLKDKTGRLSELLEQNSYVGVFTSLYAALMSSGEWVIPSDMGDFSNFLNVALSFCHMIAIAIPLFAAVIVFMMRIGILWAAIIMSPFIALFTAFDFKIFKDDKGMMAYFSLDKLIPIIFSPAIICFAVSLSTVLVNIIAGVDIQSAGIMDKEILGGLIKLNIGGLSVGFGKLVVSVLGVAVTWFLMWAAIKSTKLGDLEIVQGIKKLATNAMGSMPIVPIIGKGADGKLTTKFIGTRAAFGGDGKDGIISTLANKQLSEYQTSDQKIVDELFDSDKVKSRKDSEYKKAIIDYTPVQGTSWTTNEFEIKSNNGSYKSSFASLSDGGKEEVINAINDLSEDKRKAFGDSQSRVQAGDKVYEFKDGKYQEVKSGE